MSEHTPPAENTAFAWTFGSVLFDEGRWELSVNGEPQTLEPKPLEVLAYLLRFAGEAVTKDELLDAVWTGRVVVEAVLTNAIAKLRRALGDDDQSLIVTVSRVGYKLMGKVDRRVVKRVLPESRLHAGDAVPRRPNWKLDTRLDTSTNETEVWLARHSKTGEKRVFKFSLDGARLSGLKREATVSRLLQAGLGERDDIVRVIDWDFEDAPYFLECEYGGQDLLAWSDAHDGLSSIPLAERIDWLRQIAETVDAAHGLGVLHKDLKPANLLLIEQNGTWRPRVADFGSSALTGAAQLEQFGITNLGFTQTTDASSASGTPYYMAPEVVAGGVATAKSDIYALGVLLYQLVTGDLRRPMAPGWESDIEDPLLREDIAQAANGQPDERMASAGELASRLQRLESRRTEREQEEKNQVAQALLASQLRRARARRPWIAALGLVLVAGLGTSLVFLKQAQDAETAAQQQLDTAQALLTFMTDDLLSQADPDQSGDAELTLSDAIDHAEASIGDRFKGRPLVEGRIRHTLSRMYAVRAKHDKALEELLKTRKLLEQAEAPLSERIVDTYITRAQMLTDQGHIDEANQELAELRQLIDQSPDAPIKSKIRYFMGKIMIAGATSNFPQAIEAASTAKALAQNDPTVVQFHKDWLDVQLARYYVMAGESEKAMPLYEEFLPRMRARPGKKSQMLVSAEMFYTQLLLQEKKYDEALEMSAGLKEDILDIFGPDYPGIGSIHSLVAEAYRRQGKASMAADSYQESYEVYARTLGEESPYTLEAAGAWAMTLRAANRALDSLPILERTLESAKKSLPAESPLVPHFAWQYAYATLDTGNVSLAASLLQSIDPKLLADSGGSNWPHRLSLLRGRLALIRGDKPEALSELQDAIDGLQDIEGDPSLVEDAHKYKAAAEGLP